MADRAYTDAELDAAIAALSEPGRLQAAQDLVARAAPALHRVLDEAIGQGGWFDSAHEQAVREATGERDPQRRTEAVRTLISEETRLGMFVGVTVGFELARELRHAPGASQPPAAEPQPSMGTPSGPNTPPAQEE